MDHKSTVKTGNEPVGGADPGGTRPTKPGQDKRSTGTNTNDAEIEQRVESGDRNTRPPRP